MAKKKIGKQTVVLDNPVSILSYASTVGKKEGEGPLGQYFDVVITDDTYGEDSFELAESKMVRETCRMAISKAELKESDIDYMYSGDLLNQLYAASFAARELQIPYFGLFGACSTMAESLSLASMNIDGGYSDYCLAATSSHFGSAERQFRFPLELGSQRKLTAQWTVTGSGAVVVTRKNIEGASKVTRITTGKVIDYGIKDANNMGAVMAPSAVDTIYTHFEDTGLSSDYYDLVLTGDLGKVGHKICKEMLIDKGLDLGDRYNDCGIMMFDHEKQDTHSGGSGCGCSASILCSYLLSSIERKKYNKILLVATGALLSVTSSQQKQSIPAVAHAVAIENI